MKQTFGHTLLSSFYLWFDHYLLTTGQAFVTTTDNFYKNADTAYSGYNIYRTNYNQLVYDAGVPGAVVMSGVYPSGSSTLVPNNSGIKIDYLNGRVLAPKNTYNNGFSGQFSYKEFNTYITASDNQQVIFENIMGNDPSVDSIKNGLPIKNFAAPCSIICMTNTENQGFSFGGHDMTKAMMSVLVICKDQYQAEGVTSLFRDSNNLMFPMIPASGMPLDQFGNLKNGMSYNYNSCVTQYGYPDNLAWIKKVHASRISEKINNVNNYYIVFLDFVINKTRYPRLSQ